MTRFAGKAGFLLALGALAVVTTPRAFATSELTLDDGLGHTATVFGTSCGGFCSSAVFSGVLGNWNINVSTGTSDPTQQPIIDLNSVNHHNAGAASTLTIKWSATDYTPASSGFLLQIGGTIGAGGTLTAALFGGNSNTILDVSHQIGTTMTFNTSPFSQAQSVNLSSFTVSPYSLTEVTTLTFGSGSGQASYDYSVDAIPEPAGVLLLGSAILFTASAIRRKVARGKRA